MWNHTISTDRAFPGDAPHILGLESTMAEGTLNINHDGFTVMTFNINMQLVREFLLGLDSTQH